MNKITTLLISVLIGVFCFVPVANASTVATRSAEVHRVISIAATPVPLYHAGYDLTQSTNGRAGWIGIENGTKI
ncbi:MAG: hypothetical protein Q8911_08355 [Bacillota bacterium]|nr:hypothetical protein [Bacillota bacterium]